MKRVSRLKKLVISVLMVGALTSAAAGAIAAAGDAITVRAGNLILHADFSMSPKALPKGRMAPITVRASGSAETADGTHIPPAKTLDLQVDRHMGVESTGLPSCTAGKIEATTPPQALRACGSALVGKGFITAQSQSNGGIRRQGPAREPSSTGQEPRRHNPQAQGRREPRRATFESRQKRSRGENANRPSTTCRIAEAHPPLRINLRRAPRSRARAWPSPRPA